MREWAMFWEAINYSQMASELENITVPGCSTCVNIWYIGCGNHHVVIAVSNKTNTELSLSCHPGKKLFM